MPSQYKQINKVRYERDLLDLADKYAESGLSLFETQAIWKAALDGRRITDTEMRTLKYIMAEYPMDEAANAFLGDKIARAESGVGPLETLAPGESGYPSALGPPPAETQPAGKDATGDKISELQRFTSVFYNPGASKAELDELLQVLSSASRSLDVAVFALTDDRLAGALLDRHAAGVRVRVVADDEQEKAFDTSDLEKLREAGIEVRLDQSRFHMHHKFAIVDNQVCVNGSLNWTTGAIRNNRENIVVSRHHGLAARFTSEFERLWTDFGSDAKGGFAPHGVWDGNCVALFFPDTDDGNLEILLREVEAAKKTLDVAMFTLTMRDMKDAMLAAHRRAVRVRVITDDRQARCHKGTHVAELREAGIEIRTDHSPANMHHKFCVIDGRAVCSGSFNWTRQAEDGNHENIIIFRDEMTLADDFSCEFEQLWVEFS